MLSVLAVIGKIIGFTLLGILGLVILILLVVLFVPFRWKIDGQGGKFEEGVKVDAGARVTWLLHLVSVRAGFKKTPEGAEGEGVDIAAKLLGIKVFPKKKKEKKDGETDAEPQPGEGAAQPESGGDLPAVQEGPSADVTARPEPAQTEPLYTEPVHTEDAPLPEGDGAPEEKEKKTLTQRLDDLSQKADDLEKKKDALLGKAEKVWDFVTANTTQEELALLLKRLGKMAKHYIPKKFEGYARVGLSDPATTGKILMYWYSFAYPRFPDSFRMMGEFDEEVIEGDLHLKGHIRLNHIVWFGLRMLLDRKFRKLIKQAKRLMKDLKTNDEDREDPGEEPAEGPESGEETRKEEA